MDAVTFKMEVVDDKINEGSETFSLKILDVSLPHGVTFAQSADKFAGVTIQDDDDDGNKILKS